MFNLIQKWNFPSNNYGQIFGIADSGVETFKGTTIKSLAREICQNSLDAALDALEADHDYLTAGGVFPERLIQNFIAGKRKECLQMAAIPHPAEFEKYYNL